MTLRWQKLLMGAALLAAVLVSSTGCTTLRPIEGDPAELQQRINSGDLLKPGDRVVIVASDGRRHRFAIKSIDAGLIKGRSESVPIEQVASLQQRQFSRAKSAALVIGIGLACTVIGLAAYAATHLSVGF
jgi:hypothetical protein